LPIKEMNYLDWHKTRQIWTLSMPIDTTFVTSYSSQGLSDHISHLRKATAYKRLLILFFILTHPCPYHSLLSTSRNSVYQMNVEDGDVTNLKSTSDSGISTGEHLN
jgi:hypothetical protein